MVNDVITGADQEAIVALLAKMAVDKSMQSNVQDAREAMINANVDMISKTCFRAVSASQYGPGLITSEATMLCPLYTLALMKNVSVLVD